jgi:hypothetical protein
MLMKPLLFLSICLLALRLGAQNYSIDWFTIDGGGGVCAGGVFAVSGTIGQPDAGAMSGGNFSVSGGFWSLDPLGRPVLSITHHNGIARISWLRPASGYLLDQASTLITPSPPNTWSPVQAAYQTNASEISVSVPTPPGSRFYRLRRP